MTIRYLPTQATSQVMMPSHVVTLQIHYLHPFSIGQYARSFLSWCAIRTLMQQNQLEKPASFNNFCMEWLLCSVACPRVLGSLSCCFMLFHAVSCCSYTIWISIFETQGLSFPKQNELFLREKIWTFPLRPDLSECEISFGIFWVVRIPGNESTPKTDDR